MCNHIYRKLLTIKTPTAQCKWEQEGISFDCWGDMYEIPYKVTTSTKLQSLHFRIIHRYIPTRKFLCSRNIIGSRLCLKCFEVDTLEHFFYRCTDVREIWDKVLCKITAAFRLPNSFVNARTVLLGSASSPNIINLVILLCKQYIVACKLQNNSTHQPSVEGAIKMIINQHEIEKAIAKKADKLDQFWEKWEKVVYRNHGGLFQ